MALNHSQSSVRTSLLVVRGLIGGILMGLANLVPGISGGTMLLAAGVYPLFITAIAEITRLQFRLTSLLVLGTIAGAAGLAILLCAGFVKGLVVDHRWIMYSLFIGLTLGGLPVVWKITRPATNATWIAAGVAFLGMAVLSLFQQAGADGASGNSGMFMLFVAGLAGASAMILPGISGGYLLLLLGQYIPILAAIEQLKNALSARDIPAIMDVSLWTLAPVGVGVILGIVLVSNALKWLLQKYEKATLGALLGLLLGAVVGLWPFQVGVQPQIGDMLKGRVVTEERLAEISPDSYPTAFFTPTMRHGFGALLLIVIGFSATTLIARMEPGASAEKKTIG